MGLSDKVIFGFWILPRSACEGFTSEAAQCAGNSCIIWCTHTGKVQTGAQWLGQARNKVHGIKSSSFCLSAEEHFVTKLDISCPTLHGVPDFGL